MNLLIRIDKAIQVNWQEIRAAEFGEKEDTLVFMMPVAVAGELASSLHDAIRQAQAFIDHGLQANCQVAIKGEISYHLPSFIGKREEEQAGESQNR